MTYQLFPHQIKGAEFLSSRKFAGLFFGMGTGKTITALEAAKRVGAEFVVVIAPPIALPMWQREAEAYLGGKAQILKTGSTKIDPDAKIVVVSYAIAQKRKDELRDELSYGEATVLICDESHALKNPSAKRTKAILGKGGVASGAVHSWLLTGTPITRWHDDMYAFLCRADLAGLQERCGGTALERFQMRFTVRQERKFPGARFPVKMVVGNRNGDELADWVYNGGHALRVDLDEVFKDMPPLTTNAYTIPLELTPELKAKLAAVAKMKIADLQKAVENKEPALATIRRELGMAKVKAAAIEISERVESGQNILVGAWHTDVIDALRDELAKRGYTVGVIDGRKSALQKEAVCASWNNGTLQVVVGQIAAMGVSLNLQQGGSQIIVVEEDWSPTIMDQFYARLWRYGQEKHVHVDILRGENKLEEAVGRIARTKARGADAFNEVGREVPNG
jgi:SNF2 family DNA or RNA helicase